MWRNIVTVSLNHGLATLSILGGLILSVVLGNILVGDSLPTQDKHKNTMANNLKGEKSSYLQSAAHQPVHWQPWNEETFREAKELNKPILLDIGAAWCHWCHVMDVESYENEEIARMINENFVPVKVDRDERPDIDARYQTAVSAISGQGGWPLTAFLTSDGKPFYGGTYFPPDDRYGRPGLKRLLLSLSEIYKTDPKKVFDSAQEIQEFLKKRAESAGDGAQLSQSDVDSTLNSISSAFDVRYGGFGSAPKFPHASAVEFLLWRYSLTKENWMISIVDSTLRGMGKGGIYDQLGGGFHRYSTDERWIVPHFEKMLYDNAELLKNYVHAYHATSDEFFKEIALGIINYANAVLSDKEHGGFYASQDADIGMSDDGDYYTWTLKETKEILTPEEVEVLSPHYNIYEQGEMHAAPDRNVLFVDVEPEDIAKRLNKPVSEVKEIIRRGKEKLLQARWKRKAPFVDKTIYTNWNAMMISSYIEAYKVFGEESYLNLGLKSLNRILTQAVTPAFDVHHAPENQSVKGFLDDYVQLSSALLDAYEVTADEKYLSLAEKITNRTIERFWDKKSGGFNDLPVGVATTGSLDIPHKPIQDSPSSGSNGVAIFMLNRLYQLTESETYKNYTEQTLKYFAPICKDYRIFAATYYHALDTYLNPPPHVVVIGEKNNPRSRSLHQTALRTYRPDKLISFFDPKNSSGQKLPSVVANMVKSYDQPIAYVCTNFICAPPAHDEATLANTLKSFGYKP